jgi:hypothetical protein
MEYLNNYNINDINIGSNFIKQIIWNKTSQRFAVIFNQDNNNQKSKLIALYETKLFPNFDFIPR